MNTKKESKINKIDNGTLILTILSVVFLALLVVSASFAYFMVTANNNSSTTKINATVEDIGSVSFESTKKTLTMNLTGMQMMQLNKDVPYYASNSGTTTTETSEILGYIEAEGNGTFDCEYELEIKATSKTDESNLYTKFQGMAGKSNEQIVFSITTSEGTKNYDFNKENLFPIIHPGKVTNLVDGSSPENITAQLKFVNKTGIIQDDLENGDITLSISVKAFKCDLVG